MAREYMITETFGGVDLQITGDEIDEEHHDLHAASDSGRKREAEEIISERFYNVEPFPGFEWVEMKDGWRTTDHDLRSES